jgi:hypothetical protein
LKLKFLLYPSFFARKKFLNQSESSHITKKLKKKNNKKANRIEKIKKNNKKIVDNLICHGC